MEAAAFLEILHQAERLKDDLRHSYTSCGRRESVAEHSWRLALMALFAASDLPGVDAGKLIAMCLVHDLGEAFTGDIPVFEKTEEDVRREQQRLAEWVATLPPPYARELGALFEEMDAQTTPEARAYLALDKMEAVLQHNEAPISTWLPLEYTLNREYGREAAQAAPFLAQVRQQLEQDTLLKIQTETP